MKRRRQKSTTTATDATPPTATPSGRTPRAPPVAMPPAVPALDPTALTTLAVPPETPSKRKSRTASLNGLSTAAATPSPHKNPLATPRAVRFSADTVSPPPVVTNADKSARRKSARHMISRALELDDRDLSGADDDDSEDALARRIYGSDGSDGSDDDEDSEDAAAAAAAAAKQKQKPQPKRRGRPKKAAAPEPAPAPEPEPASSAFEGVDSYFHQNRKARAATSSATLATLPPLDHSAYFGALRGHAPDHAPARAALLAGYRGCFDQWAFELASGFNLLLYGYGSKRALLLAFAAHVYTTPGSVVVFNGYNAAAGVKDLLTMLAASTGAGTAASPNEQLDAILARLDAAATPRTHVVMHNIDGESVRGERAQALIARLAAHPKIALVASMDHIRAPLLWDAARASQLNFLHHDCTTFEPYSAEIPADEVLALVDGGGRAGGTKGVRYVLASLPANAKRLFKVLVSHQLQAMAEDPGRGGRSSGEEHGIEYRVLYQRAASDFICSNDVAFRTLLKEFQDHQMVSSKKDGSGTEVLWAPFRKEDLEGILEDIVA
ncbi:origin recognition complex subunit 2-domain-containing protein [Geopyxis carbonaria]|nr:origin recognition complex subunit 2-domain-containing protein [Geopyxis carbonaria]